MDEVSFALDCLIRQEALLEQIVRHALDAVSWGTENDTEIVTATAQAGALPPDDVLSIPGC